MRKVIFFILCLVMVKALSATTIDIEPSGNVAQIFLRVGKNGELVSLLDLASMRVSKLESLTGKKMKFAERLAFKAAQHKLQNSISADGTIESKKLEKYFKRAAEGSGFHAGGFALGLFLEFFGVIIAYLINDEKKKSRVKWAWIGLSVWVVVLIVLLATGFTFRLN